jgi:hypothetical protein
MQAMIEMNISFPKPLGSTVEFILNRGLCSLLEDEDPNLEQIGRVIDEIKRWSCELDRETISYVASKKINGLMKKLYCSTETISFIQTIIELLSKFSSLSLELDLWEAQNTFFVLKEQCYETMKQKSSQKDQQAANWLNYFTDLAGHLSIQNTNADTPNDL